MTTTWLTTLATPVAQARFKYPPHWVPIKLLWRYTHTHHAYNPPHRPNHCVANTSPRTNSALLRHDSTTKRSRGYVLLRRSKIAPLLVFRIFAGLGDKSALDSGASTVKTLFKSLKAWPERGCSMLTSRLKGETTHPRCPIRGPHAHTRTPNLATQVLPPLAKLSSPAWLWSASSAA